MRRGRAAPLRSSLFPIRQRPAGPFTPYQPLSLDTTQATLWSETSQSLTGINTNQQTLASTAWSWAYCPTGAPGTANGTWICLNGGATFDPTKLYEIVFTAANPLVLGVGYAATRDLVSFFRSGTTAPGGGSNPIAGSISKAMTIGSSQAGSFIRSFIFYGFNEDENTHTVFDGVWPQDDGRILWMNERWAQPAALLQLYMGGDEAPVWWADFANQARSLPADGILHRCTATSTCPQVLETFSEVEFYGGKMGSELTGFCSNCAGEFDIPLPSNVHRYFYPGTNPGSSISSSSFTWSAPGTLSVSSGLTYPSNPNGENFTNNALQADFISFVLNGTAMPTSSGGVGGTYPTLAAGQLQPNTATAVGFPTVPSFPYGGNNAWLPIVYNFGPGVNYDQQTGAPTIEPPTVQQVLTPYVPSVNSDGNANGGAVASVLFQAPLGTYVGWNLYSSPSPYAGQQASLNGGFWPFYDTAANRQAAGDTRLSLEERYGTNAGYQCVVANAVSAAVTQRLLLSSDATTLADYAAASNVLTTSFTPTAADTALEAALCANQPVVFQVASNSGPAAGGTAVTITGNDFSAVTAVDFGGVAATFTVDNRNTITAISPPGAGLSTVNVTVTTSLGTSSTNTSDQFAYGPIPPTVAGVSPNTGPPGGGTAVTISGTNFTGATAVNFGSTPAASFIFNSAISITATSPPGTQLATVDVTVTTPQGTSVTSSADQYTYGALPAVTAVSPTSGPTAGGTSVTITGTNFTAVTAVNFGSAPAASFTANSATSITAKSPAGSGTVDVTVTTPSGGTSATGAADQFKYAVTPAVTAVSPNAGPLGGGTGVTITGTNFTGATAVAFGSNAATAFTVVSATSITATAPPGGAGTVDIAVTTPGGISAASLADHFLYTSGPSVSGVSPKAGPIAGGTVVTVSGANFTGATAVKFGVVPATFTVNSATQITATSPAGSGTVDVTVTAAGGTSPTSTADQFSYAPPAVAAISPANGPTLGGTTVSIGGSGFTGATAVNFGSTAAASFTVNSDSSVTATAPNGIGTVDVTVTTPVGTSAIGAADQFSYQPSHDFNGDGKSDLLWRDASNNIGIWLMNGSSILQSKVLGAVPGNWAAVGQRDFNGDGNSDVLWRDTSGYGGFWLMNGTQIASASVLGLVPTTWSVAATGDFNADGKGDVVWRDTSGNVGIWLMNGTAIISSAVLGNVPTNWVIAGADAKGEIFWRNRTTGEVGLWIVNGATIERTVDFGAAALSWSIAGVGDFDGNGSTDILWRDTGGNVGIWLLSGTQIISTGVVGNLANTWTVAQTGDYTGDGRSDILWIDNAGNLGAWFMNGTAVSSTASYGNVGTSWSVQSSSAE